MNPTKLLPGIVAVLLIAASAAMASDYHRDAIGPTTVNVYGFGVQDFGAGGFSVPIALDGSAGEKDISTLTKVSGDCTASPATPDGEFSFSCGVDRDDDGFVTNVDASSTEVRESDGTKYDDDSTGDVAGGAAATVCFREDVGDLLAGSGFDEMAVFIAINVPSTDVGAGAFVIDVNLAASSTCSPSSFGDRTTVNIRYSGGNCNGVVDFNCTDTADRNNNCKVWTTVVCIIG
jgi:hypothetical protein